MFSTGQTSEEDRAQSRGPGIPDTGHTWAALLHTLPFSSSSFNPTPPFNSSIIIPTMQNHIRVNTTRSPLKALPKHVYSVQKKRDLNSKWLPLSTLQVNDPQQHYPHRGESRTYVTPTLV